MSIFNYIKRKFYGLPAHDSKELISAKRHRSSYDNQETKLDYDLHIRKIDQFMFGTTVPMSDENDLLNSNQLERRVNEIYKLCNT